MTIPVSGGSPASGPNEAGAAAPSSLTPEQQQIKTWLGPGATDAEFKQFMMQLAKDLMDQVKQQDAQIKAHAQQDKLIYDQDS